MIFFTGNTGTVVLLVKYLRNTVDCCSLQLHASFNSKSSSDSLYKSGKSAMLRCLCYTSPRYYSVETVDRTPLCYVLMPSHSYLSVCDVSGEHIVAPKASKDMMMA